MSCIPARHSRNRVKSAASSRWSPPRAKGSVSRSLRGSTSGNWLMLHPPLGRVGFARVVLRAIAGQIAAMSLGVFPRLDITRVEAQRYRPVDAGGLRVVVFRV